VSELPVGRRWWSGLWLAIFGSVVLFLLMLPTVIVIPMSFSASSYLEFPPQEWSLRWYRAYFGSPQWMDATVTSLQAAVLTTLIATPLGTLAAYGLTRMGARWRTLLQLVVLTPLVVPVILVAVGVFHLYALVGLNYTLTGVVAAHVALALPFVVITVMAGLRSFDFSLEQAARSLGASRARAFLTITVPHVRFSIQTGAFLAFITSLDEVVVAMLVSGGENATITRRMFNALRDQIDPTIAAISTCLIVLSVLALVLVQVMAARQNRRG